jgi:hypothetical protein
VKPIDIAWVAGIVEGEGTIGLVGATKKYPRISVDMTDKDIVHRLGVLWNVPVSSYAPRKNGTKPYYKVQLFNQRAIEWLLTLYTFLGTRRREKGRAVLTYWRSQPTHHRRQGYTVYA